MSYQEAAAGLSCITALGVGFLSYLNLKLKSDMSKLKGEILQGINGKYYSRAEVIQRDILLNEREDMHRQNMERLTEIAESMTRAGNQLRIEFTQCRAEHSHFHKRKDD
jgi:hypothetical protein